MPYFYTCLLCMRQAYRLQSSVDQETTTKATAQLENSTSARNCIKSYKLLRSRPRSEPIWTLFKRSLHRRYLQCQYSVP